MRCDSGEKPRLFRLPLEETSLCSACPRADELLDGLGATSPELRRLQPEAPNSTARSKLVMTSNWVGVMLPSTTSNPSRSSFEARRSAAGPSIRSCLRSDPAARCTREKHRRRQRPGVRQPHYCEITAVNKVVSYKSFAFASTRKSIVVPTCKSALRSKSFPMVSLYAIAAFQRSTPPTRT